MPNTTAASTTTEHKEQQQKQQQHRHVVAASLAGTTVMGTLALTAPFILMNFRSSLPFMATPGHKVYRALCHIRRQQQQQQQQRQRASSATNPNSTTFVDLGSGDGEAVYQALLAGYTQAVGIELNFTLFALAQIRRWFFWTADERARSTFLWNNLFNYHVGHADTVMVFGVNPLMKPLSEKLARECKAGTHVLSYRFVLPTAKTANANDSAGASHHRGGGQVDGNDTSCLVKATLIYKEEEMQIYRIK